MVVSYGLHVIATHPSDHGLHMNPVNPRRLGTYATEGEAQAAGRVYLRSHPDAWLQTQDDEQRETGRDVEAQS